MLSVGKQFLFLALEKKPVAHKRRKELGIEKYWFQDFCRSAWRINKIVCCLVVSGCASHHFILEKKYSTSALEKDYGLFWLSDLGEFTACSAVANPKGVLVWRCDYWNTRHPFWLQSSSIQQRLAGWLTAVLIVLPCASQIEAGNTGNCVNAGNGKVLWHGTSRI